MSKTDKVRPGIDANIVEANVVRGHDAILPGNAPENLAITTARNEVDDTVALVTVWNRTDQRDEQVLDLRGGIDFDTAERVQVFVGDADPTGLIPAVLGSLYISTSPARLFQNIDGATGWKTISDDLGGESLEETLAIGNTTGDNAIIISDEPLAIIQGEDSSDSTGGGDLSLRSGNESGGVGDGGDVSITTGTSVGGNTGSILGSTANAAGGGASGGISWVVGTADSGDGGAVTLTGGVSTSGKGGNVDLNAGSTNASGAVFGGFVDIDGGDAPNGGAGGFVRINAGSAIPAGLFIPPVPVPDQGGEVQIFAGNSGDNNTGGAVRIRAGDGGSANGVGGDVLITPGVGGGGAADGIVDVTGILQAENIKRGDEDPNTVPVAGNEGDVYQRTVGGIGQLWVNSNGTPTGWELLAFAGSLVDSLTKAQQGFVTPSGDSVATGAVFDTVGLLNGVADFTGGTGSVSKTPSPLDSPALTVSAPGGGDNEAGFHMANLEARTQRQHRFVAAFKFATVNIALNTDNRAFIGFSNLDGPDMLDNDSPVGEYVGLMKRTAEGLWTFLSRGPSGIVSGPQFAYNTTNDDAHFLVLDFSDPDGDDIVATVLDDQLNVVATRTWTTTSGPDFGRGPAALTNLAPVIGCTTEFPGQDAISLLMHNISVVPEADEFETGGGGSGGVPTLEAVLNIGNETGASSIVLTDFDALLGGVLTGEDDPAGNFPDGGRVSIQGGDTSDLTGTGGSATLLSGLPATGSANTSGLVLVGSGRVADVTNTGGTGDVLVASGQTAGSGNTGLLTLATGDATSGDTGTVVVESGASVGGKSGDVDLHTGDGDTVGLLSLTGGFATAGAGGPITITGGDGGGAGSGTAGDISLLAGNPDAGSNFGGGEVTLTATAGAGTGDGGPIRLIGGAGGAGGAADGGLIEVLAGDGGAAGGTGGQVTIEAGDATGGVSNGGDIVLTPGAGFGGGASGAVIVNGKLTVTGLIDPTGLLLTGQAVAPPSGLPGIGSGDGLIWVDNTGAASVPKFTDDQGVTVTLGGGSTGDLDSVLTAGNFTNGQTITGGNVAAGDGNNLILTGGNSTGGLGAGGDILLTTGSPDGAGDGAGGTLSATTAAGTGAGVGGDLSLTTGSGDAGAGVGGRGGDVSVSLGDGGADANGGAFTVITGGGTGTGSGGSVLVSTGDSGTSGGSGGSVSTVTGDAGVGSGGAGGTFQVTTGAGDGVGDGGDVQIAAGSGGAGGGDGGSIAFAVGSGGGGGSDGTFDVTGNANFSADVSIGNKLTVPLIDPIGIGFTSTASNPIAISGSNDATLWTNPAGDLILTNSGGDVNVTGGTGGSGNFLDSLLESAYGMISPGTTPSGIFASSVAVTVNGSVTNTAGVGQEADTLATAAGSSDAEVYKSSFGGAGGTISREQQYKAVFKFKLNGASTNQRIFVGLTSDSTAQLGTDNPVGHEYVGLQNTRTGTDLEFVARGASSAITPQTAIAVDTNIHFLVIDATSTSEVVFTLLAADGVTVEATHTQASGTDIPSLSTATALLQGIHSGDGGSPNSQTTSFEFYYSSVICRADILPNVASGAQTLSSVLVNGQSTGGTNLVVTPGDAIEGLSQSGAGGNLVLNGGDSLGGGGGGNVTITAGINDPGFAPGSATLAGAGAAGTVGDAGGAVSILAGAGADDTAGGIGGIGGLASLGGGDGGNATAGGATAGDGGGAQVQGGDGGDGSSLGGDGGTGGDAVLRSGFGGSTVVSGAAGGDGGGVVVTARAGGANTIDGGGGIGGALTLTAGAGGDGAGAGGVGGDAGAITVTGSAGGAGTGTGDPGDGSSITLSAGDAGLGGTADARGGQVVIQSGTPGGGVSTTDPGGVFIRTEDPLPSSSASTTTRIVLATTNNAGAGNDGAQGVFTSATGSNGGNVSLAGGTATSGTGGNVVISSGTGPTHGKIRLDGERDPDGSAYKFGLIPDPGPWVAHPSVNTFTFSGLGLSAFPPGTPLTMTVTLEQPPGSGIAPVVWIESVSATGFDVVFSAAPAAGSVLHWTARH